MGTGFLWGMMKVFPTSIVVRVAQVSILKVSELYISYG